MRAWKLCLVVGVVVLTLLPTRGDMVEDGTGGTLGYQSDAGSGSDAPDACGSGGLAWQAPVGSAIHGVLVPEEDLADVFVVNVTDALVGTRMVATVSDTPDGQDLDVHGYTPACSSSILDPSNWPVPFPTPPAPLSTEVQLVLGKAAVPASCDATEWRFRLKPMAGADAPASIHVAWTDGNETDVPLDKTTPSQARYITTSSLGVDLKGAWANVASTSNATLQLVDGPCSTIDGGAVYGDPPQQTGDAVAFTPIQTGLFELRVTFGPRNLPTGAPSLEGLTAPRSLPVTCHFCVGPYANTPLAADSYTLTVGS